MRSTTSTYKQIIASGNTRQFHVKVNMTLVDDTQLTITDSDIMQGSFKYEMASSSTTSFDLGSAVIGMCKFQLENYDERYTGYDFFNGEAVVWVKLEGDSEFIRLGFFTVDEPTFAGGMVSLELLDNMWKFDVSVSDVNMSFPISCVSAVNAVCNHCGVLLNTQQFHGYNFQLTVQPEQDMNCREFLQYVAMITCNFCVIDDAGKLNLKWYDTSAHPSASLDGGTFSTNTTPYSDGDTADGGNFTNYNSGADIDGGTFIENNNTAWFTRNFSASLGTDEITITGVKITIDDVVHRIGGEGYVLEIENPLVNESNVNAVLNLIWDVLNSFRFRTFSLYTLPDISAEIGDACAVRDLKGNIVYSYITLISFNLTAQTVECNAVTPTRKLATRYSKSVQTAVEEARKRTDSEISRYDVAVQMMNNLAVNAIGGYQDYEDLETGGRIYYLSNKPITKTECECHFVTGSTVFKVSGEGFFVSEDGGQTWVNGYSHGELVVNVLNAIGINADWVQTGLLRDKDGYNYWDLDHNIFHLAGGTTVGTGGTTLDDFAEKDGTIADVDVEYAKNQSSSVAPTTGWSTDSPQWEVGYYIWQRTKTTDGEGTVSYSNPTCIQGAKGEDGVSINSVTITYGVSNSPSTQPSSWQSTIPVVAEGQYLWTRTVTDYTDPTIADTVTYTYAKQGEQGQAGTPVSVDSIQYQQGDSATTAPTGAWSNTPVTVAQGKYLWTRTTFSDHSVAYGVARQGEDGEDGVGISSVTIAYGVSDSASTQPSTWQSTVPTVPEDKYLWIRTITDYTDSSVQDTVTYTYSKQGKTGQAGTSVSVQSIQYQAGTSSTTPPSGTWSDNPVTVPQGQYLWTKTTLSDGTTPSVVYGIARQGEDGTDGDDGVGVTAIVEQYAKNQSTTTAPTTGWSSAQPVWENGYYIWTRSQVTWTDGTVTTTTPVLAQGINQANKKAYDTDTGLNQYEIMSRLAGGDPTNPNQGIFLYNNKVYINAEFLKANSINADDIGAGHLSANYIQGGTLTLGGYNNASGLLEIKNATGVTTVIRGNSDGLYAIAGQIGGAYLTSDEIYRLGTIVLTDTFRMRMPKSSTWTDYSIISPFRPNKLFLKATSFKITVDWAWADSNNKRNFFIYLWYYSSGWQVSDYTLIDSSSGNSGSYTFPVDIYTSDTKKWKVTAQGSGSASTVVYVDFKAYVQNTRVVSITDGYWGEFNGTFQGTASLQGASNWLGFKVIDDGWLRYFVDDKLVDISPDTIELKDGTSYGRAYISFASTPRIQLRKSGTSSYPQIDIYASSTQPSLTVNTSSTKYISLADGEIEIQEDSDNWVVINNVKLTAHRGSTSKYIDWTSGSDRRVKKDINPLDIDLSKNLINATEVFSFKYISEEDKHYGVIAQDMRKLLDSLGETDAYLEHSMGIPKEKADMVDQRAVAYTEFIPHLINYVKDLRAELNAVKEELRQLKEG